LRAFQAQICALIERPHWICIRVQRDGWAQLDDSIADAQPMPRARHANVFADDAEGAAA